ncbi:helix-turn-helix transcriptional regulator [Rhodococcus globerulus]|uniref:WYL domain-containing protein n=1 Tax=Rhodococcus globerulus TaxID=33008 RepID=A0ABU4C483_RHOGO|nr:WYL domain-containing protein [Rhodococcus globerulus]MDV6271310.1 WYL domain-containing protein [Rhodococcus globerulus]
MISSSARLLDLLALLSSGVQWTSTELANRMNVDARTIRRDVGRLRDLGYVVESDPGPWGGYRLGTGGPQVPPLVLDDEEALAVVVSLREAAGTGVLGGDQAVLSALFKLRRVLPVRVAEQLRFMDTVIVHSSESVEQQIDPDVLLRLATACRRFERLVLSYRNHDGVHSVREVDAYCLVRQNRRWYLVAKDVTKGAWRTFRADRVLDTRTTGNRTEPLDAPDAEAFVAEGISSVVYPIYATVRLPLPVERAQEVVPPTIGTHTSEGSDSTIVAIGGNDTDMLVTYLLGLGVALEVLSPRDVRESLLQRMRDLIAVNTRQDEAGTA